MLFNAKLVIGVVALAGIVVPIYFFSGKGCSFVRTDVFQKVSLDTSETVLECAEDNRSYSVYLVPKESSGSNSEDFSFKVVENNSEKKVKWGPDSDSQDRWNDWAVAIYKNGEGGVEQTKIRVPNVKVFRGSDSKIIPCQKSKLKFRDNVKTCLGGAFLKNSNLKFEVDGQSNVKMKSDKFEWSVGFSPKRIFCSH